MKFLIVCGIFAGAFIFALGQEEVCPPGWENTHWPHPNCSLYYVCRYGGVGGSIALLQCQQGLYWHQGMKRCEYPDNVPECQGGTRPPYTTSPMPSTTTRAPSTTTTAPPTTFPTSTTTKVTTTTTTPRTTTTNATSTTPRTTTTNRTSSSTTIAPGICPPDGIHKVPHETLCDSYYICLNGTMDSTVFKCPEGLLFDPSIEECNIASDVECNNNNGTSPTSGTTLATTTTTESEFPTCPLTGDVSIPYPGTNCTLYIRCIEHVPTIYRCPNGQLFDSVDHQCKNEEIAVCNEFVHVWNGQEDKDVEDKPVVDKEHKPLSAYFNFITKYFNKNDA